MPLSLEGVFPSLISVAWDPVECRLLPSASALLKTEPSVLRKLVVPRPPALHFPCDRAARVPHGAGQSLAATSSADGTVTPSVPVKGLPGFWLLQTALGLHRVLQEGWGPREPAVQDNTLHGSSGEGIQHQTCLGKELLGGFLAGTPSTLLEHLGKTEPAPNLMESAWPGT